MLCNASQSSSLPWYTTHTNTPDKFRSSYIGQDNGIHWIHFFPFHSAYTASQLPWQQASVLVSKNRPSPAWEQNTTAGFMLTFPLLLLWGRCMRSNHARLRSRIHTLCPRDLCPTLLSVIQTTAENVTHTVITLTSCAGGNFSLPRPLCSRLRPDIRDIQTSVVHRLLMPPPYGGGDIIKLRIHCQNADH